MRVSIAVGTFLAVLAIVAAVVAFSSPDIQPEQAANTREPTLNGSTSADGTGSPSATDTESPDGETTAPTDDPSGSTTGAAGGAGPVVSGNRPVASPQIGTSSKKVFAHYFPPYPISFENADPSVDYYARNYLTVHGENDKHVAYGGLLRDRPIPRAPLSGQWAQKDFTTEVRSAVGAGLDGFAVNILGIYGDGLGYGLGATNWTRVLELWKTVEGLNNGFVLMPNLDATASGASEDPARVASKLAQLLKSPVAYRLPDGRPVLSSFKAEDKGAAWWGDILNRLSRDHGLNVAFIAVFLNSVDSNMRAFKDISYGFGNWGMRTPGSVSRGANYAKTAHDLGKVWMQPVAVQDVRPNQYKYSEAANTENLRVSWNKAINDGADLVQMVTWNDYSESTTFAPSVAHGTAFLDITAYYIHHFKTGSPPAIANDAIFVTHRIQRHDATPQVNHGLMKPSRDEGANATPPRDTVEALVMLTAPATITVNIGGRVETVNAPAGVSAYTFPLGMGTISAQVQRSGSVVLSVRSPFTVVERPNVQDLQYYAVSSVRG